MLDGVRHFSDPFAFFTADAAIGRPGCEKIRELFEADLPWKEHGGSFYEVSNCDATPRVDAALRGALVPRMSELTGVPLADRVAVTLQRMQPGQQIGLHCDRPLVGYETVRLVVQLGGGWQAQHGGVLRVHSGETSETHAHEFEPRNDTGFGFVMGPDTHHSVTPTRRVRDSVVFNFWHVGNDEGLRVHVQTLFEAMHFADLPADLTPIADAADLGQPEEATYRAGCVATVLMRWGYPLEVIAAGYREALPRALPVLARLRPTPGDTPDEPTLAILLARWAAYLHLCDYDLRYWQRLDAYLRPHRQTIPAQLRAFLETAFVAG